MIYLKKIILFLGDVTLLYSFLLITLILRYGFSIAPQSFKNHIGPFSIIFIIWILIFYLTDAYHPKNLRNKKVIFRNVLRGVIISGVLSVIAFYLFGSFFVLTPKTNLFIFIALFFVFDLFWRFLAIRIFSVDSIGTLILGDSNIISETVAYLRENPHAGYAVHSWIKDAKDIRLEEVLSLLSEKRITLVVVAPPFENHFTSLKILYHLIPFRVNIIDFPDFYESIFEKIPLRELSEQWFIEHISTLRPFYDLIKNIFDFSLAFVGFMLFLPIMALVSILIKISSEGSVIFLQERVGENGNLFTLYKFRTMYNHAKGSLWTDVHDSRITPIGKFLRFTHLDELPQLINVLKGNISFIGPRPESKELADQYKNLPYYEMRHIIKPGITGWAQVNYKPSISPEEAYNKLCYDMFYVKNRSMFLDILIFIKTIRHFFIPHMNNHEPN